MIGLVRADPAVGSLQGSSEPPILSLNHGLSYLDPAADG
jgi:hypothetical protein